jgi:hypothetical protein
MDDVEAMGVGGSMGARMMGRGAIGATTTGGGTMEGIGAVNQL